MTQLFQNLGVAMTFALVGWICLKAPRIKKINDNHLCEDSYNALFREIMQRGSRDSALDLENQIDDFYNEYAGRAVHAKEYATNLYSLITQLQNA